MYRLFQVAELGISVSESTVVLKYSPFDSKNIPTDEITSVQTYDEHDYDPGWGVGVKRLSDGAKQYRMYGDAVKINEENGDGILVTTRDPDELASVLERVTSN